MTEIQIALAGNPNSGKTSSFNSLTGANQYVGNWPGVTVERKEGSLKGKKEVMIQDLPGIYSLSPYTPEEVIARDYLIQVQPDAILNVVDATNLERNLYLTTQLLETGIPVTVALNMMDIVEKSGITINVDKLAYGLGLKIEETSAVKGKGLKKAVEQAISAAHKPEKENYPCYDKKLEAALAEISSVIEGSVSERQLRWYTIKLFERDARIQHEVSLNEKQKQDIEETIQLTEQIFADDCESIIVNERYEFITQLVRLCVVKKDDVMVSTSDKIDRIVTNRWLALPIFAFVMWLVYYLSIRTVGVMGTNWVNDVLFGEWIPDFLTSTMNQFHVADWMQQLILNGIVAGVGAVLGFLPQMIVLFLCLAFLEDCGYMSRIAFVMDRMFRKFGLSGKSFIPILVATGCGVPGVMSSRTIENEKDRRMTVMVTTFIPCSAKLPIIGLIAGAFFPHSSWVAPSAYFVGMGAIVGSGMILKKTRLFAGDPAPFIMELPAYHLPQIKGVFHQTWNRSTSFVKKAGTIIFVSSILIWFTSNFNFSLQMVSEDQSILAKAGGYIAPIFYPLGWGNWRAAVATITGLIAKENVVGTFGILYGGLEEVSEKGTEVWPMLQAAFTPVAGYSFLLFNLLCAPCFAAIGAMKRELVTWKWTAIAVGYQCGLAYVVSFIAYQFGVLLFEGADVGIGQVIAGILVLVIGYLIFHYPKKNDVGTPVIQPLL